MPWIDPIRHGYGFRVACPLCWLREISRLVGIAWRATVPPVSRAVAKTARVIFNVAAWFAGGVLEKAKEMASAIRNTNPLAHASRLLGFTLLLIFVAGFAAIFAGMAGWSVMTNIIPPDAPVWKDVRCIIGLPLQSEDQCWQERMSQLEAQQQSEVAKLQEKNRTLGELQSKSEAKLRSIQTLEDKFEVVNLFTEKQVRHLTVTTGVEYRDLSQHPKWSKAWCYTEVQDGALRVKIELAVATARDGVTVARLSSKEAAKLGNVSAANLAASCQWPRENS